MIPVPPLAPSHAGALVNPARRPTAFAATDDRPALAGRLVAVLAFVVAALAGLAPAAGQCEYDVTVLPCLYVGDYPLCPTPTGMNNVGQIVGYIDAVGGESARGFVWSEKDGLVLLPTPQGVYAVRPRDINDAGMIVGEFNSPGRAFMWDGAAYTELGIPPGGTFSNAQAINEDGVVVGTWGNNVVGPALVAFVWQDGVMTDLGPRLGTAYSRANDINNAGQIAGWMADDVNSDDRAFRIDGNELLILPPAPGALTSSGDAINESGDICGGGIAIDPNEPFPYRRGFAWLEGKMRLIPRLHNVDARNNQPRDMNNSGVVVGYTYNPAAVGFVWRDGNLFALTDFLPEEYAAYVVECIEELGRIAATVDGPTVSHGGALLTPRAVEGDVDSDCTVDLDDLLAVLLGFGCRSGCGADADGDGDVDLSDLAIVIANFPM